MSESIGISPEVEALILAELAKRVRSRQNLTKALIGVGYADGDKQTFRSPVDGRKLGVVYRSDPDPEWRIVDMDALFAHLRQDPANLTTFHEVTAAQDVISHLLECAPHLLVEVTAVSEAAVQMAMERAQAGEAIPGIERVKPEGVLTVRPDKAAGDAIEAMVKAGAITWDGRPALAADEDPVVDVPVINLPFRQDQPRSGGAA